MRKIILFCLIFLLVGCSDSPKSKADKLIDTYLKENLKDPSSYECIKKGNLGLYTPMTIAIEKESEKISKGEAISDTMDVFLDHVKKYFIKNGTNPYDTLAWELSIKYRAKNTYGGYEISNCIFYFDKGISHIINVENK
ncbi:MAG: hypothetical protein WCS56_05165 [Bacilli bacterium]|jgi:hypothetical protein